LDALLDTLICCQELSQKKYFGRGQLFKMHCKSSRKYYNKAQSFC